MQQSAKIFKDSIANSGHNEQVLVGILPKHMNSYIVFKYLRFFGFVALILSSAGLGFMYYKGDYILADYLRYYLRLAINYTFLGSIIAIILAYLLKFVALRKAPFDDWVYEIAKKRLGTEVIFYDSKYIYIQFDRGGKEVDKREFVLEMSDKSIHYSYFYVKTFIDVGFIMVLCKKRRPIPKMAKIGEKDDEIWNAIPLGLCVNNNTQEISPILWYLNDKNINEKALPTIPSVSILISGGTGCYSKNQLMMIYNNILR